MKRETVRHSRSKSRKYLKENINDLAANKKNKNTRDLYGDINEFDKGYQTSSNLVKDEIYDLLGDSHNILNRLKDYICQLLDIHGVGDNRQKEIRNTYSRGVNN
jgi:hypothetical protein